MTGCCLQNVKYSLHCNNRNIIPHHWHLTINRWKRKQLFWWIICRPSKPHPILQEATERHRERLKAWFTCASIYLKEKRAQIIDNVLGVCSCRIKQFTAQVNSADYVKMASSKSQHVLQNKTNSSLPKLRKVNECLCLWIPCSPYSNVYAYQRVNFGAWCLIYLCVNFLSLELCTKYCMIFGFVYKISLVLWRLVGLSWMLL